MTPSEAINAAMKGRTRLINGTLAELRALLQQAERDILALLAALTAAQRHEIAEVEARRQPAPEASPASADEK